MKLLSIFSVVIGKLHEMTQRREPSSEIVQCDVHAMLL